jgi:NAD(P)-dependent dehydrogenase (short-subunit alcohol dehydrogenase family)
MPINIIGTMIVEGPDAVPGWPYIKSYGPVVATVGALKWYFRGKTSTWERDLHGKVYIVTGGTSGVGAAVVEELAARGAQLILLVRSTEDFWTTEYIQDLRERHENLMIYAEECDLSDLYSIRKFATKWLDNVPPRRIDGILCCAGESLPYGKERQNSVDGIEIQMAVNYVGHYHLLMLLTPGLKVQLPDRDIRIVLTTCMSQAMGTIDLDDPLFLKQRYNKSAPWRVFGTSKLQLSLFGREFQRRLQSSPRKDGAPCNVRVNIVNPGLMRSPSTKRVFTFGSLIGLLLYTLFWPILWIFLRSTRQGAQSYFHALMCPDFENMDGGNFIADCSVYQPARSEVQDEQLQKKLYDSTERAIAIVEKESAIDRKRQEKKQAMKKEKKGLSNQGPKVKENVNAFGIGGTREDLFPETKVTELNEVEKPNSSSKSNKVTSTTAKRTKSSKKKKKT